MTSWVAFLVPILSNVSCTIICHLPVVAPPYDMAFIADLFKVGAAGAAAFFMAFIAGFFMVGAVGAAAFFIAFGGMGKLPMQSKSMCLKEASGSRPSCCRQLRRGGLVDM